MKTCRTCQQQKPADAYRDRRNDCRDCEREKHRAWYASQPAPPSQKPEYKAYYREWYAENAERVKANAVQWAKDNPDKRRKICRVNMERQRSKLTDAYVRRMLAQGMGLLAADIPQPLVEAQRELLKIKRYIREHSI
jgi:ABC-type nitrate/sulfonate/bicarbonate transport system substrate-binding protein